MSSDNGITGNGSTSGNSGSGKAHQFRGKAKRRARRKHGFSQASTRRPAIGTDQHGREWSFQVDLKSGTPVGGPPQPLFTAPWYPDHQYVKVNPDNVAEIFIDYEPLFLRRNARLAEFHERAVERAAQKDMPLPAKGKYSKELLMVCGGMPRPIQPVVAAMQGNRWVLGLTHVVDERLEPFVRTTRGKALAEVDEYDFRPRSASPNRTSGVQHGARTLAPPRVAASADAEGESIEEAEARIARELAAAGKVDDGGDDDGDGAEGDVLQGGADVESLLDELDSTFDPEAVGGRTIAPQNTERAKGQAPRRPTASAERRGGKKRPTLAEGAAPVIGRRGDAD